MKKLLSLTPLLPSAGSVGISWLAKIIRIVIRPLPPRSNKRAARCNATWSFITGNHVVRWLEFYHHCGSTKKITVMAYTLALRHLLIQRAGSRWNSAARRPVLSSLLPAELQLLSEQWLAQYRDTVLNSDVQPVVLRPRRNSGWQDAVWALSR